MNQKVINLDVLMDQQPLLDFVQDFKIAEFKATWMGGSLEDVFDLLIAKGWNLDFNDLVVMEAFIEFYAKTGGPQPFNEFLFKNYKSFIDWETQQRVVTSLGDTLWTWFNKTKG